LKEYLASIKKIFIPTCKEIIDMVARNVKKGKEKKKKSGRHANNNQQFYMMQRRIKKM